MGIAKNIKPATDLAHGRLIGVLLYLQRGQGLIH